MWCSPLVFFIALMFFWRAFRGDEKLSLSLAVFLLIPMWILCFILWKYISLFYFDIQLFGGCFEVFLWL